MRQTFLYNNLMYAAAGYIIELQSGKSWEQFVKERIFEPLGMTSTRYSIAEMVKQPEFGVGYTERRDSFEIYHIPYYEDIAGVAPCGAIASNIEDMSHWLIALMKDGKYEGKQVLPSAVLKATMEPAIGFSNTALETRGWGEELNATYGMARELSVYRGHLLTKHGGDLPGFHTQVSFMPQDHVGVIVFEIGNHSQPLYNIVSYNVYERLLGMSLTPWSERQLEIRLKDKKVGTEARTKAGEGRVPNTKPSHALADYVGTYDNAAYGPMKIGLKDDQLQFDFHKIRMPMTQFHYDRFDTRDDEEDGKWAVNFRTNPQGDVDQAVVSLDESEAVFVRKPDTIDPKLLAEIAGTYKTPDGGTFDIKVAADGTVSFAPPGQPPMPMKQSKAMTFKLPQFSDLTIEFLVENGKVTAVKQKDPSGEFVFPKK